MKPFLALFAALLMIPAAAQAQTYIVDDPTEHSIEFLSFSGLPSELVIDIPDGQHPDELTFDVRTASFLGMIPGMGNVYISENLNGTWGEVDSVTPDTAYRAFGPIKLNPRARQFKIHVKLGATMQKYIKNIKVTPYTGELVYEEQTITWEQTLDNLTVGSETELTATASSGLAVVYESSDSSVCDLRDNILIAKKEGTAVITATQPGDDYYESAPGISAYATVRLPSALPDPVTDAAEPLAYPNPVKDILNISGVPVHSISIYDMQGRLMLSVTTDGRDSQQIDCSALPDGIYIVKLLSGTVAHQLHIMKLTM